MGGKLCNIVDGAKPAIAMVVVQLVFGGVNIFYKLAINDGMNTRVLIAYRYIFATAFISPLAFILERKSRPRLTWMIALQGFLCGLFGGALGQNLYLESLTLTSATFSAAMTNLIPAVTFIFAIFLGLEKLAIRTRAGKAKVTGTLLGIGGAMVLTFYKGPQINIWSTKLFLLRNLVDNPGDSDSIFFSNAPKVPSYKFINPISPHECEQAKMGDTGFLASGVMVVLVSWCVLKRGPLFVSTFNPLMLVFVAILGSLILDEKLHLGRSPLRSPFYL
ncbi:hypothetical protein PVL29_006593 [Vitis rotundifolia]|uniref:WAT1-related protein n=1 Tax=Vitis rotundifolia TaxID=103349 RepID=A0AA39A6D0_VITRO|nr:hypothetical protein PVL29_006593 [Vitis rotundifolia]